MLRQSTADGWGCCPSSSGPSWTAPATQLANLDAAVAAQDAVAVSAQAHRLRGAAANLGAVALAEASAELEECTDPEAVPRLAAAVADALAAARSELERLLAVRA
jgi:HPt (histidine-containing phosphotransfer) domain-containing protein